jgi:acetyl-CoA carboxylase biotin carboxyl carrier protein
MKLQDIEKLIKRLDESSVTELKWTIGEEKIVLKKEVQTVVAAPAPIQAAAPVAATPVTPAAEPTAATSSATDSKSHLHEITSPMVGSFYSAPSPEADSFVKVGDRVKKGQVVCIVEAMKLMNEIEADADGVVEEICLQNEAPVEFGTVLFRINKG